MFRDKTLRSAEVNKVGGLRQVTDWTPYQLLRMNETKPITHTHHSCVICVFLEHFPQVPVALTIPSLRN